MTENNQNEGKGFFGKLWANIFWTKITDLESSRQAASNGVFVIGWLAVSYTVNILLLFFYRSTPSQELKDAAPEDSFQYNFDLLWNALLVVFLVFIAHRIYKQQKFGFIPFVCFWILWDVGYGVYLSSEAPQLGSVVFGFLVINSFKGWLGVRKFEESHQNLTLEKEKQNKRHSLLEVIIMLWLLSSAGFETFIYWQDFFETERALVARELDPQKEMILINVVASILAIFSGCFHRRDGLYRAACRKIGRSIASLDFLKTNPNGLQDALTDPSKDKNFIIGVFLILFVPIITFNFWFLAISLVAIMVYSIAFSKKFDERYFFPKIYSDLQKRADSFSNKGEHEKAEAASRTCVWLDEYRAAEQE
ncbi:MAG: hypothetical protein V6Z81_08815 [Parvularculales bacterium]